MTIRIILNMLLLTLIISTIAACGGGGGGGGTLALQPTAAILKLAVSGTLSAGTSIGGLDVTVALPSGVTVKSTTAPVTDTGVVVASGQAGPNASIMGTYTPATDAAPAEVRVLLADANGFGTGTFATVTCDIASSSVPQAAGFTVQAAEVKDLNGAVIPGMTATVATTFR